MSEKQQPTIPYASFVTAGNLFERLATMDRVPDHIDRSMLTSMSGATQTALLKALEFLGLIGMKDGEATDTLRELIDAKKKGEDQWKPALRSVIEKSYRGVIGDVDIRATTPARLEAAFREAGVKQGQMLAKSLRFYVKALQACGVNVPQHVAKIRSPSTPKANGGQGKPRKKREPKKGDTGKGGGDPPPRPPVDDETPEGFSDQAIPTIPGAFIRYRLDMDESDLALYDAALSFIKVVVKKGGQS